MQNRKGAPIGNLNALKHGYTSKAFKEIKDTTPPQSVQDELKNLSLLIRLFMKNTEAYQINLQDLENLLVNVIKIMMTISRIHYIQTQTRSTILITTPDPEENE